MKRRNFLRQTSGYITLPTLLRGLPLAAASSPLFSNAIGEDNDKILILIQLIGGNDGLNTIIPLDKYDILGNARSNILIPESQVLKLTQEIRMHPSMQSIKALYDDASMTVLQDVGYPNQNRSHFRSSDIWNSGSPADEIWNTGWIGRYLEDCHPLYPENYPNDTTTDPFALSIGSVVSETCQGTRTNFSLAITDPLSITPLANNTIDQVPDTPYGRELAFLRTTIDQANEYGEVISEAAAKGSDAYGPYPDTGLGEQLKAISLLISGGLKTKIYIASIGGFDTHANQTTSGDPTTGNHAELLKELSDAVYALQTDLKSQGLEEKVISMTFSEFGRRIRSNASLGTDHGSAAPMMLFGSCINAGIIGESPLLPDIPELSDGVPMQYDFRSVYSSILMDWFDIDRSVVTNILGDEFSYIPLVNGCNQTTATEDISLTVNATVHPNPFYAWSTISLESKGEHTRIGLYDSIGHELDLIANRKLSQGPHEIRYDGSHLPSGNYFCRITTATGVKTMSMIKVR